MAITYHAGRRIQGLNSEKPIDISTTEIYNQGSGAASLDLYTAIPRVGIKAVSGNTTGHINKIKVWLRVIGTHTSTNAVYVRVRKISDDSIVATATKTIADLTSGTTVTEYEFDFGSCVEITEAEHYVLVEYAYGDASNYLGVSRHSSGVSGWEWLQYSSGAYSSGNSGQSMKGEFSSQVGHVCSSVDVQIGSRWEETDTRKMYHYEEQVPDYDYTMTTDPRTNTFNSSLCTITHANSTLQMNQITNGGAGGSATYIDLGSNLSTKWVMRFKTKQTAYTSYAGNSQFQVGMSSVAPTSTAYQISSSLNWIGIRWYFGTQIWSGGSRVGVEPRINQNAGDNDHNNSTWNGSGNDQRLYGSPREVSDTTTPYYHEIIWNVDTFTYNLYDNANYTGTKLATATMSSSTNTQWVTGTPSSISGLRYFVFKEGGDSSMGVWVNQLDDVEIWDGVTVPSTGNAWKEEGT